MDDLAISEQVEEFLKHEGVSDSELLHFGVKGMKWGKRKAAAPGSQRERNEQYKSSPTARQYFLGSGKDIQARAQSRRHAGKIAVASILVGAGAKLAVNNVPQLAQYKSGVTAVANGLQQGGYLVGAYTLGAGAVDRAIERKSAKS